MLQLGNCVLLLRKLCCVLTKEKIEHVGKLEHQSILVVVTHSCYHRKENLPKEEGSLPLTALRTLLCLIARE